MNNVDKIFQSSSSCDEYVDGYLKYLGEILTLIDRSEVVQFIQVLMDAREASSTVYFIGNGGSAATASHFANDISIGTRSFKKPFRTVSLCDNQAVITAIGNDNGYENIFYEQLAVLLKAGDVVVGISASGNSENIIRAMEYANQNDAITVGLTAFDGGEITRSVEI